MSSFRGSYDYTIDVKGRLNIPAKFRKAVNPEAGEVFVVIPGPSGCLRAYPQDTYEAEERRLDALSETRATLARKRIIDANKSESKLDGQGRVMLSPRQIKYSRIEKEVTLVGSGTFIEIWDTSRHAEYLDDVDFDEVFFESVDNSMNQK